MTDTFVNCLKLTYQETNNEIRSEAEQYIDNFCQNNTCFNVIFDLINGILQSQEKDVNLLKASLNVFSIYIVKNKESVSNEQKHALFENFIKVIPLLDQVLLRFIQKISNRLVECFFPVEWSDLPNFIERLCSSDETFISGTVLAKSLSRFLNITTSDELYAEIHKYLCSVIVPIFSKRISTHNYIIKNNIYHVLSRILGRLNKGASKDNIIGSFASQLGDFIGFAVSFQPDLNNNLSLNLCLHILKFFNGYSASINDDCFQAIFMYVKSILKISSLNNNAKKVNYVLLSMLSNQYINVLKSDSILNELIPTLFDFFTLTNEDVISFYEDPYAFVREFTVHSLDTGDEKQLSYSIINKLCRSNQDIFALLTNFVMNRIQISSSNTDIWACFRFYKACTFKNSDNELFINFLSQASRLFDDDDPIVRASIFMFCSNPVNNKELALSIAIKCLAHLSDGGVVSFYAALSLLYNFHYMRKNDATEFKSNITLKDLHEIIHIYVKLSLEFLSEDLTESLVEIISFFDDELSNIAPQLTDELLKLHVMCCLSEDSAISINSFYLPDAIIPLLKNMQKSNKVDELNTIFTFLMENTGRILATTDNEDKHIEILCACVEALPVLNTDISPIFDIIQEWLKIDEKLTLDEIGPFIFNVVNKSQIHNIIQITEKIMNTLFSACRDDDYEYIFRVAGVLCIKFNGTPEFQQLVLEPILNKVPVEEMLSSCVDELVSMVLMTYGSNGMRLFGSHSSALLQMWSEKPEFPYKQNLLLDNIDAVKELGEQVYIQTILSATNGLFEYTEPENIECDEDDDLEELLDNKQMLLHSTEIPHLFDSKQTVDKFVKFIKQLQQQQPDIFESIENIEESIEKAISYLSE